MHLTVGAPAGMEAPPAGDPRCSADMRMMERGTLHLGVLLAATAIACRTAMPVPSSKFPFWNDLSFRGFAQEALFGYATQRTRLFDDYTKGSYHIRPAQLASDLPVEAKLYGLDLVAVVVVGPYGPLWSYDVLSFVRTPTCVRINWLLMPHARITVKRSGCVPVEFAEEWLVQLEAIAPVVEAFSPDQGDHCVLIRRVPEGTALLRQTPFGCYATSDDDAVDRLEKALELLMPKLEITYSGYPPVPEAE
jgi:hypothetical protein